MQLTTESQPCGCSPLSLSSSDKTSGHNHSACSGTSRLRPASVSHMEFSSLRYVIFNSIDSTNLVLVEPLKEQLHERLHGRSIRLASCSVDHPRLGLHNRILYLVSLPFLLDIFLISDHVRQEHHLHATLCNRLDEVPTVPTEYSAVLCRLPMYFFLL